MEFANSHCLILDHDVQEIMKGEEVQAIMRRNDTKTFSVNRDDSACTSRRGKP
jgi:hypothetical protein